MQCPHCHHNSSRVVDSRPTDGGRAIRRRRECENCGFRFTTFERVEQTPLLVIKKNGTREEFNREKILKVMSKLADVDDVAYIRFASVYRQFKDMSVFMQELQDMMKKEKTKK